MQKLKATYDAAQEEEDKLLNSSEDEDEENATDIELTEPLSKPPPLEKALSLVDSLLASGLNEPALLEWKENIKRPEKCKLLQETKVTSEIWDITQKTTWSMATRLQKVQESLVKSIIPIASLWELQEKSWKRKGQFLLQMTFGKAYPTWCFL